jgi:transposase
VIQASRLGSWVIHGYELSDFEWGVIAPMLPNKPRGVPRVDDRDSERHPEAAILNDAYRAGRPRRLKLNQSGSLLGGSNRSDRAMIADISSDYSSASRITPSNT